MSESKTKQPTDKNVVAKAGIWFTICNFLFRGMSFITTPIFTRLLTKEELGNYSNLASWIAVLIVITSFDLSTSIIRSKIEHEDDIDSYIWSILSFSTIFTLILYAAVIIFKEPVSAFLQMDMKYVHLMFLYFLTTPAYSMLITKHRAFYRYKLFVLITAIMTVCSTGLSLLLVICMDDKLLGRAIGQYAPSIVIGAVIFIYLAVSGKKIKMKYWKYAIVICLPLVPHTLSIHLLSSSDKIIITKIAGSEYSATYSVASNVYQILSILLSSMNHAWTPWLFENMHHKNYDEIKKFSRVYVVLFIAAAVVLMLVGPEMIWIFGGKNYKDSVYCLAPLLVGCIFQFVYTMLVNIEFYSKKTVGVAFATAIVAAVNIILNLIFIPMYIRYSYVIAAYTTLVGYVLLFILHYLLVKRLGYNKVFDIKLFSILLMMSIGVLFVMNMLYKTTIIRYLMLLIYTSLIIAVLYKYKNIILLSLKKSKTKNK